MKNKRDLDRFLRFLKNDNKNNFLKSIKVGDVKKVIKYLNVNDDMFFNASLKTLQVWGFKLKAMPDFIKLDKIKQTKISNAFQAFIAFCFFIEDRVKEVVVEKDAETPVIKHVGLKRLVVIKKVLNKVKEVSSKILKLINKFMPFHFSVSQTYINYRVKVIPFANAV
ncbi:MAG TPA: hypothetical protein VNX01_11800 [Bacteroidia bacterium]|jgi:hypothetical protein|nr:hypothetical protein [Bacteroidia bacterium]